MEIRGGLNICSHRIASSTAGNVHHLALTRYGTAMFAYSPHQHQHYCFTNYKNTSPRAMLRFPSATGNCLSCFRQWFGPRPEVCSRRLSDDTLDAILAVTPLFHTHIHIATELNHPPPSLPSLSPSTSTYPPNYTGISLPLTFC
ncbi:hypothetical protein CBL_03196 [Carabus blaptoides fortunei]